MLLDFRKIKKVTVTYEDGTTDTFEVPESAGFHRHQYQWDASTEHGRTDTLLDTHEIFWSKVVKSNGST